MKETPGATAPAQSTSEGHTNRRAFARIRASDLPDVSATLTTGPDIRLIDISRGGALFECSKRLVPGSAVALRLVTPDGTHIVRGRVVRARIVRLERGGLGYQAAVAFNEALKELKEPSRDAGVGAAPVAENPGVVDPELQAPAQGAEGTEGADDTWVPPMLTLTASVTQSSAELREIFNGNEW